MQTKIIVLVYTYKACAYRGVAYFYHSNYLHYLIITQGPAVQ